MCPDRHDPLAPASALVDDELVTQLRAEAQVQMHGEVVARQRAQSEHDRVGDTETEASEDASRDQLPGRTGRGGGVPAASHAAPRPAAHATAGRRSPERLHPHRLSAVRDGPTSASVCRTLASADSCESPRAYWTRGCRPTPTPRERTDR